MKVALINQPSGLGDIIWIQPILERLVRSGWSILYPVVPIYLDWVKKYLPRRGVTYILDSSDFRGREFMGQSTPQISENFLYLPLVNSSRFFPGAPVMASKYFLAKTPLDDYRCYIPRIRDFERESKLAQTLGVCADDKIRLITRRFGTPPSDLIREFQVKEEAGLVTIEIDHTKSELSEFSPFDWIGLISRSKEIHFVATSFAFIADIYASKSCEMHLYDRVSKGMGPRYLTTFEYVHRNPQWIYHL